MLTTNGKDEGVLSIYLGGSVVHTHFTKIFFSETAWPIKVKFYVEYPWVEGTKVFDPEILIT